MSINVLDVLNVPCYTQITYPHLDASLTRQIKISNYSHS